MNRALRRLVHGEEEARREKRQRLQLILKQRLSEAGAAAAATTAASAADGDEKANATDASFDDDDDDEMVEQQKLIASATAHWRCVEDSQQAVCIAANRRQTLLAIGEKDGRVSLWDTTTIRVITKELDPTLIVLPVASEETAQAETVAATEMEHKDGDEEDAAPAPATQPRAKRAKLADGAEPVGDDHAGSADGDSATNEDGSVDGNDDASVEAEDDDDDDDGAGAMDVDETGSVEDNLSVDETGGDEAGGDGDDDSGMAGAMGEDATATAARKLSEGTTQALTLEELKIAKTSLKHVLSIAWSCDSRLIFAGCEEKSTRRGRLCVWDAESAWLLATFSFDSAVNALSAHPTDPDVVLVCSFNAMPVLLNFRTREMTEIAVPIVNETLTVTPPPNSRHPSLVVCCRYGVSGRFIYCATSKSTITIVDSETLECVDTKLLSILIQFVDLTVNAQETALAFTSSKGVHEYAIHRAASETLASKPSLEETRLFATGAVRAPWALCCFSSDGEYVVGMPIVRHRHVGESGLYTWHRGTGRVQHNLGVKDGVNSICWDVRRDAIVVVSCAGAIHVLEEEFKTEWPGTMYPAGFRLVTDNELDMEALERELEGEGGEQSESLPDKLLKEGQSEPLLKVDVFSVPGDEDEWERNLPPVPSELQHIPSIPITQHLKRHFHHDFHVERHFGLGQSVFEPLKSTIKKPSSDSKKKKKKSGAAGDSSPTQQTTNSKSKSKSKSSSSKKRRR